jgi:hypothetical protein
VTGLFNFKENLIFTFFPLLLTNMIAVASKTCHEICMMQTLAERDLPCDWPKG